MTDDTGSGAKVSPAANGNDLSNAAEQQFEAIRRSLSHRRRELGLSMSELARQVGVSPSMVSQIERGQTLPSVATLFALAAALGATVDTFFTTPEDAAEGRPDRHAPIASPVSAPAPSPSSTGALEHRYVVRRGNRPTIDIHGGVRWERLTPAPLDEVEFLELVYQPHAQSDDKLYRHPGIEMVLVLEGRFDIHVGFEKYELLVGDSIQFPSSLPHRYVNPTGQVARAVTTIVRDSLVATEVPTSHEQAPPTK